MLQFRCSNHFDAIFDAVSDQSFGKDFKSQTSGVSKESMAPLVCGREAFTNCRMNVLVGSYLSVTSIILDRPMCYCVQLLADRLFWTRKVGRDVQGDT